MSAAFDEWVSRSEGGEELPVGPFNWYTDEGVVLYDTDDPTHWIESTLSIPIKEVR